MDIVSQIKRYTKLMYLKYMNVIDNNDKEIIELKNNIDKQIREIKDLNEKIDGYGSIADALISNSIYIEYIMIDDYYCEEKVVYKNDYFDWLIDNNDINFIQCVEFINIDKEKIIFENIKNEFLNKILTDKDEINSYIEYFLTNTNIQTKIDNIKLIKEKFNNNLNNIEISGTFLAKLLINTFNEDNLYSTLENLVKKTFTNKQTLKDFNKAIDEYNKYAIPF